jgi:hypothetical protein
MEPWAEAAPGTAGDGLHRDPVYVAQLDEAPQRSHTPGD